MRRILTLTLVSALLGGCALYGSSDTTKTDQATKNLMKENGISRREKIEGVTIVLRGKVVDVKTLHETVHPILKSWRQSSPDLVKQHGKKHLHVTPKFPADCQDKRFEITLKDGSVITRGFKDSSIRFTKFKMRTAQKIEFACEPISYALN